jgi:acyl dehydratase
VVLQAREDITHTDPEAAVRSCFGTVFAASIIRTAYGPGFATAAPVDDDAFLADLGETAVRYLLAATDR